MNITKPVPTPEKNCSNCRDFDYRVSCRAIGETTVRIQGECLAQHTINQRVIVTNGNLCENWKKGENK